MRWNPESASGPRVLAAGRLILTAVLALGAISAASAAEPLRWETRPGYRFAPVSVPADGQTGFTLQPPSVTGISFTNRVSDERSLANRNLLSGAGVAAGDVDGDGLCDLYFCGLDPNNILYRNLGNWKFEDITAQAGVACAGQDSTAAAFVDIDGDGDLDLLVNSLGGGTRVFLNDGKGHFSEATAQSGVRTNTGSMSMALADVDGDGDLDLFVVNYRPTTIRDQASAKFKVQNINGRPVIVSVDGRSTTAPDLTNRFTLSPSGQIIEFGEISSFYLNDGRGRFTLVPFTDGTFLDEGGKALTEQPRDWGLSVRFYDFTGDGAPDIYVCNDLDPPDRIWVNDGTGKFRALPRLAVRHTSSFSMGIDFGDLNRDGHMDFVTVDMISREPRNRKLQIAGLAPVFSPIGEVDIRPQISQNTLQLNRGDNTFAEIAYYAGVEASEWSWHPVLLDVDLDGYEDILIPNGQLRDFQNADLGRVVESAVASRKASTSEVLMLFRQFPGLELPHILFRNNRDLTFEDVAKAWGFDTVGIAQGMALADLDNDGDLDLIINNLNSVAGVYRNNSPAPRVAVRPRGKAPNTQGIGAKVQVLGGPVAQSQEIVAGGRFLSSDEAMRVFAAGSATNRLTLEVTWRGGRRSVIPDARANCVYEIDEAGAEAPATTPPSPPSPFFEDVSTRLGHAHHEEFFDDFSRQLLMPNALSQLGPGVCWYDLNGDGFDDLIVGTGKGGHLAVFQNNGQGGFERLVKPPFDVIVNRDLTAVLGLPVEEGARGILVGSSNYEDGEQAGGMVRLYDPRSNVPLDRFPGQASSTGPMSLADVDGDGDLDLFVGGRVLPGRYPEPASSFLFLNDHGQFKVDARNFERFANLGLVSGSVFSDLDGDGQPDLVLACEWGPVRVFHNEHGVFSEVTTPLGLARYAGWWNGVTTGDVDGDGRLDIIASNWGLNTRYRASAEHPRRIYYGDLLGNGAVIPVETLVDPFLSKEVPDRDLNILGMELPFVRDHFRTHQTYAEASLAEVLGDVLKQARTVEVNTLESMVFLNRGDHFETRPLPAAAQFSPAFAVVVADFDGDGREDVFLSQNFFDAQPFTMRNDAGRGLWLHGDGRGGFEALLGAQTGVAVYGEQRGAAVTDFDHDGRVDLVVSQNGTDTKLYHNVGARPGLRIRLQGPAGNPFAIGATLRLMQGEKLGPAREIHAGSGYWSEDGAVQVLASEAPSDGVWVRWPGGKTTSSRLPVGALSVAIDPTGGVTPMP
jgi:enediyne biosynthesis protein E4